MHGLIRDRLEEYLKGVSGKVSPEFERHLKECEDCRAEVALMQEQAYLLQALRPVREAEPAAGFYARVMERIEARQQASIWSVFLDPAFGRRIAVASITLVLILGSFLALTETETAFAPAGAPPEAILAVEEHPPNLGTDRQRDRETILVDLATFRE